MKLKSSMHGSRMAGVYLVAILTVCCTPVRAADWVGDTSTDWNDGTNWSTDPALPANDEALFINGGASGPAITSASGFNTGDVFVGNGGNTGVVNHTAGSLLVGTGGGSPIERWMFIGENNGTGTYNLSGTGSLTAGRLNIGTGGTANGTFNVNTSGTASFTGGFGAPLFMAGSTGSTAALNLQNGTVNVSGQAIIGSQGAATVTQSGGSLSTTSNVFMADLAGSTGGYTLTGGSLGVGDQLWVSVNGTGTFDQSAGTVTSNQWFVGSRFAGSGTYNLSGGTANVAMSGGNAAFVSEGGTGSFTLNVSGTGTFHTNNNIWVVEGYAGGGTGTLNISGGGTVSATGEVNLIANGGNATGTATVNLNGGTLQVSRVTKSGAGTGILNLNGGVLKATQNEGDFMSGLTRANVRNVGVTIDTNGFNIALGQALEHSNIGGDNSTDGGLSKTGAGTLTLSNANSTFNGLVTVQGGTLATGATGNFGLGNIVVSNLAGAALLVGNSDSIADTAVVYFGTASTIELGTGVNDTVYGIVQTDDGNQAIAAGTYDADQLNTYFGVTSFTGSGSLTVVPEPQAALIGLMGALGLLRRRRA